MTLRHVRAAKFAQKIPTLAITLIGTRSNTIEMVLKHIGSGQRVLLLVRFGPFLGDLFNFYRNALTVCDAKQQHLSEMHLFEVKDRRDAHFLLLLLGLYHTYHTW